jgi:N-acetylmuramoyl-L-alanine amidase
VKEKDVTLSIGLLVASLLKEAGFHVVLTRPNDATLSVEQRVHRVTVDPLNADLLISVHANSGPLASHGIETYCIAAPCFWAYHTTGDEAARTVLAERDNVRYHESDRAARIIHNQLIATTHALNREVKHAVTRLLLGVYMPAILIEIGYLTNMKEVALLLQPAYQQKIARGICAGVREYFHVD